jgi:hypothetical protein
MDVGAIEAPTIQRSEPCRRDNRFRHRQVGLVHGFDAGGQLIVRRQLERRYVLTFFQKLSPCLVGIEAYARRTTGRASCRHWVTP